MKIAVVVFAYLRPDKLKSTLNSLAQNKHLNAYHYALFQDGLRNQADRGEHDLVRKAYDDFIIQNDIQSFKIFQSKVNIGLRKSIMTGVTKTLLNFDAVIVLEDDLELSENFLAEITHLLHIYAADDQVCHINAWSPPVLESAPTKIVTTNMMFCWGWATWSKKWNGFALHETFQAKRTNTFSALRASFMGLAGLRRQLQLNDRGHIKTWAVYWYWYLYTNQKTCVGFNKSLVRNTGNDGTGENCSNLKNQNDFQSIFDGKIQFTLPLNEQAPLSNMRYAIHLYIWLIVRNVLLIKIKIGKLLNK
jgi:hypothetical protein